MHRRGAYGIKEAEECMRDDFLGVIHGITHVKARLHIALAHALIIYSFFTRL